MTGAEFRDRRKLLLLTQEELAELLCVSRSKVARIEAGRQQADEGTVADLCSLRLVIFDEETR